MRVVFLGGPVPIPAAREHRAGPIQKGPFPKNRATGSDLFAHTLHCRLHISSLHFRLRLLGKSIALAVQSGGLKTGFRLTANTLRETCTRRSASPLHETQEASQCTTARFFKLLGRQRLDRPWSSYRDVILAATMELCILVGEPHPSQRIENLKTTNKESEYETVAAAY